MTRRSACGRGQSGLSCSFSSSVSRLAMFHAKQFTAAVVPLPCPPPAHLPAFALPAASRRPQPQSLASEPIHVIRLPPHTPHHCRRYLWRQRCPPFFLCTFLVCTQPRQPSTSPCPENLAIEAAPAPQQGPCGGRGCFRNGSDSQAPWLGDYIDDSIPPPTISITWPRLSPFLSSFLAWQL